MKILWDFNNYIFCDHVASARRPDLTVVDKTKILITLVGVSIPADRRVTEKEEETKYQDLSIETEHLKTEDKWIPVVISVPMGAVVCHFKDSIHQLKEQAHTFLILQS